MIYSKKDISKVYTDIVKVNLEYGYINTLSMNGTQGEDSRIDINIGVGRVRRVILDEKYIFPLGTIIYIQVIDFMDDDSRIYWNDNGDIVSTISFIGNSDCETYYRVDSWSEVKEIINKSKQRSDISYYDIKEIELDSKYYGTIKSIVSRAGVIGWKKFNIKKVIRWTTETGSIYYKVIKPNGNYFTFYRHKSKFYFYSWN